MGSKTLEYRILVENRSPAPAHQVVVLDRLPPNAKFVRASPQPHRLEPELQWQLGTLKAHACLEITLIVAPTNSEDVTNCVRVQYEHGVCATTRQTALPPRIPGQPLGPPVPPLPPKPPTKEPPLVPRGTLELDIKGPKQQSFLEPAKYVITVTNVGTAPASEVSIEAELPEKLIFIRASDKAVFLQDKVAWRLGILPANKSRSVELIVRAKEPGFFCIKTRAEFDLKELFTPVKEICTTFVGITGLLLEMYDREDPIPVNGTTSYLMWVLNQGSAPATNVRIQAVVPPGMEFLRASKPCQVAGQNIFFESITKLEPGAKMEYEVYTRARSPGDLRFKIQMTADQLQEGGPVHEEESTTVYSEDLPAVPQQSGEPPRKVPAKSEVIFSLKMRDLLESLSKEIRRSLPAAADWLPGMWNEEPPDQKRNSRPTLAP